MQTVVGYTGTSKNTKNPYLGKKETDRASITFTIIWGRWLPFTGCWITCYLVSCRMLVSSIQKLIPAYRLAGLTTLKIIRHPVTSVWPPMQVLQILFAFAVWVKIPIFAAYSRRMRAVRTILRNNCRISTTLMLLLMLWVSGGTLWQTLTPSAQDPVESASVQDDDEPTPDDQPDPGALTSLEAGVIPVCKIQLAFFCSFMRELALVEQPVERVAVDVPLPQSGYFRTLLRRIISPNAP